MKSIYDLEPRFYLNKKTGVRRISYFNVALGSFMQEKASALLREVNALPLELKREFARSFFDDEGCMDFRPQRNVRQVRGYQKNVSVLQIIKDVLSSFGIPSAIKAPNEIVIVGKDDLERFQNEIGFSAGVRINGNRPNSLWKKSLEKRELLQRAIISYRR